MTKLRELIEMLQGLETEADDPYVVIRTDYKNWPIEHVVERSVRDGRTIVIFASAPLDE